MTKLYAKLQDETIIEEMQKWDAASTGITYEKKFSEETVSRYKKLRTQLVAHRIAGGFSEVDVAKKIGVRVEDYKRMEKGEVQFGFAAVLELAAFLGVNLSGL